MSLPPPAWIFLDVGWTLMDETWAHLGRFEQVRAAMTANPRPSARDLFDRYAAAIAAGAADPFAAVLVEVGLDPARRKEFAFDHGRTRPYRDAAPALRALRGIAKLGVLANQSQGLAARLDNFGFDGLFDLVLGSQDIGASKPDPRFFSLAAERAGAPPGEVLLAGDRLDNDVSPAKRAGWRTVWIKRGPHGACRPRGPEESADQVVAKLTGLAALFVPPERLRLAEHLDNTGAITAWPEKERDKRAVLEHLAERFTVGRDYTEAEVNVIIDAAHRFGDLALLRRELIDRRLLSRTPDGRRYWILRAS